jgi:RNA polymerase sigma-70 factor (ECF subfamily)
VLEACQAEFESQRPRLLALAYRMLGSAQDAEDVVSEAWLRWRRAKDVREVRAYLCAVVTRLCVDHLKSARVRREWPVGRPLPEPAPGSATSLEPLEVVERREALELGALLLLERLSPAERGVLVLRQGFDYAYREIADVLGLGEAYCRQLHRRARARMDGGEPRFASQPAKHAELTDRLLAASRGGDLPGLEQLLAADVTP